MEKRNKHSKKNCAPIWLYLQDCHLRLKGTRWWHQTPPRIIIIKLSIIYDRSALQLRFTDCKSYTNLTALLLVYVLDENEDNPVKSFRSPAGNKCLRFTRVETCFELF
jgi:hypothetical protein